ncbi:MAG: hypothetical protein F6J87_20075 [Spirulina sp. SIO3F2]|nr:hypothetical protein [Spirulina sp. SIO3F2]
MPKTLATILQPCRHHLRSLERHEILIILGAFISAVIPFLSTDKSNVSNGFPGDAGIYGYLAQDFYGRWAEGVNSFYLGRSLPSWVLHHILHLFTANPTYEQVLTAFGILSVVAITVTGYVWCLVTRTLKITVAGAWFGFIGLFLNHLVLKASGQAPILTDFCAYALGLLLFYVYLQRQTWGMIAVTLVLTFTWPSGIYMCTLLWLFPHPSKPLDATAPVQRPPFKLHYFLALPPAIAGGIYMQTMLSGETDYLNRGIPLARVGYLSVAIATVYLFIGLSELLRNAKFYRWLTWSKYVLSWQFWGKLVVLAVLFKLPSLLATDSGNPMTLGNILHLVVRMSILQPGVFWVAHVVYFGPILIFALFFWRPICQLFQTHGLGLTAWVALMFVLSLDSESRHLVNFYPVLITFIVIATEALRQAWQTWHYWAFGILSVFTSRVWLTIGSDSPASDPHEFPSQFYFMHHGPWMSNLMYAIQSAIVLVLIYMIYDLWIRDFWPKPNADAIENLSSTQNSSLN